MATLASTSIFTPVAAPLVRSFNSDEASTTSPSTHLPPLWQVKEEFFSNRDSNADLSILCSGRLFVIHFSAENLAEYPQLQTKYLSLRAAVDSEEFDEAAINDFHDWAGVPLLPVFRQLAPADWSPLTSIEAILFPEVYEYTVYAASEELLPLVHLGCQRENHSEMYGVSLHSKIYGCALQIPDCSAWRSFAPAEVRIFEEVVSGESELHQGSGNVVLPDGTVAFLKLVHRGDECQLETELKNYKTIADAGLDESVRISRLLGLVRDERDRVFGLLLTHVDCRWQTLAYAVESETPAPLREKWASQVQSTIKQLHNAGVVWGDARPDHVLLDEDENAWIIDFGGGYTEGWVTQDVAGTVKGDLDALEKILAFIGV